MTSACGVVEAVDEKGGSFSDKASFKYGELEARGDIFEEFYYSFESLSVLKYQPAGKTYTVGDEIPTVGESYSYPDSFDVLVLRDSTAVKIRDKKITEIIPLSDYTYGGVPVINGRGFELLADSDEKTKQFLSELSQTNEREKTAFFEKWLKFDTYRKVVLKKD
jgi:sulfate adenylyltransferase subunit 1